jgi:hypothetical protein
LRIQQNRIGIRTTSGPSRPHIHGQLAYLPLPYKFPSPATFSSCTSTFLPSFPRELQLQVAQLAKPLERKRVLERREELLEIRVLILGLKTSLEKKCCKIYF